MAVVEVLSLLGLIDLPRTERVLIPGQVATHRVSLTRLGEGEEWRFNKRLIRDLAVWRSGVLVTPPGLPQAHYGYWLSEDGINNSDIQVMEKARWWRIFPRKIRYKKDKEKDGQEEVKEVII